MQTLKSCHLSCDQVILVHPHDRSVWVTPPGLWFQPKTWCPLFLWLGDLSWSMILAQVILVPHWWHLVHWLDVLWSFDWVGDPWGLLTGWVTPGLLTGCSLFFWLGGWPLVHWLGGWPLVNWLGGWPLVHWLDGWPLVNWLGGWPLSTDWVGDPWSTDWVCDPWCTDWNVLCYLIRLS